MRAVCGRLSPLCCLRGSNNGGTHGAFSHLLFCTVDYVLYVVQMDFAVEPTLSRNVQRGRYDRYPVFTRAKN